MKKVLICAALATLVSSPALAQAGIGPFVADSPYPYTASSPYAAYNAVTPYGVPGSARVTGAGGRAAAIHRCSNASSQYKEYLWGNEEFNQYRACMAINGQPE
jgi:hypothetical protein